jgi:hypothetical protein
VARVNNTTRVGSATFQLGDRFELLVTGPAHQSVSIRTTRDQGRTDWGPVIGWTDASGRWSISGQFRKGRLRSLEPGLDGRGQTGKSSGSFFGGRALFAGYAGRTESDVHLRLRTE